MEEEYRLRMPTGHYYDEKCKLWLELQKDDRYKFARSCAYCHDTFDSFERYVSTYCSYRQENIAGFTDKLDRCICCPFYR